MKRHSMDTTQVESEVDTVLDNNENDAIIVVESQSHWINDQMP